MVKHGAWGTRAYTSWYSMLQRCTNSNNRAYANYGGRGISVCERWKRFPEFLSDMGQPPTPTHTLDRIDVNRGYSPDNCRWATPKEQANNTSRNRWLTKDGESRTVAQWADLLGCRAALIDQRLRRGWSVDRALSGAVQEHEVGRRFDFNGQALTLSEIASAANVPYKRLHKRIIVNGWSVDRAVATTGKTGSL